MYACDKLVFDNLNQDSSQSYLRNGNTVYDLINAHFVCTTSQLSYIWIRRLGENSVSCISWLHYSKPAGLDLHCFKKVQQCGF